jgi:hypothetical protein
MKTVTCSCGYVAAGETAGELLADVEAHIDAVHSPSPAAPARAPASAATIDQPGFGAADVPNTTEMKQ